MKPKIRMKIRLPKRIAERESPMDEAKFYARQYNKADSKERKLDIIESLLYNGASWDAVTRSVCYYNIFEQMVNNHFPLFWKMGDINDKDSWIP